MKVIKKDMYCPNCKKMFYVPVLMSVSTFMMSNEQKKKLENGTLFKNMCPQCGTELEFSSNK